MSEFGKWAMDVATYLNKFGVGKPFQNARKLMERHGDLIGLAWEERVSPKKTAEAVLIRETKRANINAAKSKRRK